MNVVGQPISRIDGPAFKVTGSARYATAELFPLESTSSTRGNRLYGRRSANGRIVSIDKRCRRENAPGVRRCIHGSTANMPRVNQQS